jgi:hypothetical protein
MFLFFASVTSRPLRVPVSLPFLSHLLPFERLRPVLCSPSATQAASQRVGARPHSKYRRRCAGSAFWVAAAGSIGERAADKETQVRGSHPLPVPFGWARKDSRLWWRIKKKNVKVRIGEMGEGKTKSSRCGIIQPLTRRPTQWATFRQRLAYSHYSQGRCLQPSIDHPLTRRPCQSCQSILCWCPSLVCSAPGLHYPCGGWHRTLPRKHSCSVACPLVVHKL